MIPVPTALELRNEAVNTSESSWIGDWAKLGIIPSGVEQASSIELLNHHLV